MPTERRPCSLCGVVRQTPPPTSNTVFTGWLPLLRPGEGTFDPEASPRVFRLTTGAKAVVAGAGLLLVVIAILLLFLRPPWLLQVAAGLLAMFGVLGILDAIISRIILGPAELILISLLGRRRCPRATFLSAKVENDVVCMELRSGGWLQLPRTGDRAFIVRNAAHAWIRRGSCHHQAASVRALRSLANYHMKGDALNRRSSQGQIAVGFVA